MIKTLRTLLPAGSLFTQIGHIFTALLTAIAWQFQSVKSNYLYNSSQTDPQSSQTIDVIAREYNIDINQLTDKQIRELLVFVKHNPLDMTKEKFFSLITRMFPRVDVIVGPVSILSYPEGQIGAFTIGASQMSGFFGEALGSDAIYIQGTVDSYQQLRFLKWFMERYDRAKHKHIFSVITEETSAAAMIGSAQIGAMEIGAITNGPLT